MNWLQWLQSWFPRPAKPAPTPAPADPGSLLDELNKARQDARLMPLLPHGQLDMIATARAERNRQRRFRGSDSHTGFQQDVQDRFPRQSTGECCAWGQRTAEEVVLDWLEDPPHRQIMLGKFRYVGCGRCTDDRGVGSYWVADFLGNE